MASNEKSSIEAIMGSKLFDIEHALNMYALSYYNLPARNIYDTDLLLRLGENVRNCHIYLIGFVPILEVTDSRQEGNKLTFEFSLKDRYYNVTRTIPKGFNLYKDDDFWYLADEYGNKSAPTDEDLVHAFQIEHGGLEFNVVYVGQAYGKDGSRSALDRLQKHEKLQEISLRGTPHGYRLDVLLIQIEPSSRVFTTINPFAKNKIDSNKRIRDGIDKLFGTDEKDRTTLYEASLIRYFEPKYNKEFKESFPSTNLKILSDCYEKDFSAIVSEFCFDEPPYWLCSETVTPRPKHLIQFDLHSPADRKAFFSTE